MPAKPIHPHASSPSPRRVCLFGGTFDPVHNAHLRMAIEARDRFGLDRILFVPAGHPPHKADSRVAPYVHRLAMVKLACRGRKGLGASELENRPGKSFTIDTVRRLRDQLNPADKLFFLIGADAFDDLTSWHQWREMLPLIEFLVVTRPGHKYRVPSGARVHSLSGIAMLASSSGIRSRLAAGQPTPEIPMAVRAYIEEHSLYGAVKSRYGREGAAVPG